MWCHPQGALRSWLKLQTIITYKMWWQSQRTTPHTTSRSVHTEQARQRLHNRKSINVNILISIVIPPLPWIHTYVDSLISTYRLHIQPPQTILLFLSSCFNQFYQL
jgi:hypothetical protein